MPDSAKPLLTTQPSQTRYNMGQSMEGQKKKRVLVVGAGAAGTVPPIIVISGLKS